jgi:hypothetical protein
MISKYIALCFAAIFLNIITQYVFLLFFSGSFSIEISILVGTLITFLLRFFLEKKFIFSKKSYVFRNEIMLNMYLVSSILATLIFWFFEYSFYLLFIGDFSRYLGAIIGLLFGLFIKYKLDKNLTFS